MSQFSRRKYLGLMASTPALMALSSCGSPDPDPPSPPVADPSDANTAVSVLTEAPRLSDEELLQIHLDVMSAEPGGMPATDAFSYEDREFDDSLRKHIRNDRILPAIDSGALTAVAVPDSDSANYSHIADLGSEDTFELTHQVMEGLFAANSFEHALTDGLSRYSPNQERVIFGLRGCVVEDADQLRKPLQSITLKEAAINHLDMRCTMGVWDRTNQTVSAHTASTVPHLSYMQIYRAFLHLKGLIVVNDAAITPEDIIREEDRSKWPSNWRANQLGQGLHLQYFGVHAGKPDLLRQHDSWYGPVQRAQNELSYRLADWDPNSNQVYDNIHPTWAFGSVKFASAGCNLVAGGGGEWPYWGEVSTFLREVAGSAGPTGTYAYMLLTGREARLQAASPGDPNLRRLRFGSSGADVLALQQSGRLLASVTEDGLYGRGMHYAAVDTQRFEGLPTDGIMLPEQA